MMVSRPVVNLYIAIVIGRENSRGIAVEVSQKDSDIMISWTYPPGIYRSACKYRFARGTINLHCNFVIPLSRRPPSHALAELPAGPFHADGPRIIRCRLFYIRRHRARLGWSHRRDVYAFMCIYVYRISLCTHARPRAMWQSLIERSTANVTRSSPPRASYRPLILYAPWGDACTLLALSVFPANPAPPRVPFSYSV